MTQNSSALVELSLLVCVTLNLEFVSTELTINLTVGISAVGDGRLGFPEGAPYDAIHVGAAAATVPKSVRLVMAPETKEC